MSKGKSSSLGLILCALLSSVVLSQINSGMVNVALNTIMESLNTDVDKVTWVVTIYLLGYTVFMPIYGRLGDMFGHRQMFLVGVSLFAAGSLLCYLSNSFGFLIFSRLVQASGSASFTPMSLAIIANTFPDEKKGQAVGFWGASIGVGAAIGPTIGGFLIALGGWNTIFLVGVFAGLTVLFFAFNIIPKANIPPLENGLDVLGAVFLTVSLTALLLFLTLGKNIGWLNYPMVLFLVIHIAALVIFIYWEQRVLSPLVDLSLIVDRVFLSIVMVSFIQMFTQISSSILLPLYLLRIAGINPTTAGFIILFQPAVTSISSPFAGKMVDKYGTRYPVSIGLVSVIVSMLALSIIGEGTSIFYIAAVTSLFGFGCGFCASPLATASTSSTPNEKVGSAIGLYNMFRYLGSVFGSTITGVILKTRTDRYLAIGHHQPEAKAVANIYLLLAIVNVFAFLLSRSFDKKREL